MKTKTIKVCDAIHIDISCKINDLVDVRCGGGAPILGYDFFVSPDEDIEDLKIFLMKCINKYHRPFIEITTNSREDFPVKNLWTKKEMEKCIKENSLL